MGYGPTSLFNRVLSQRDMTKKKRETSDTPFAKTPKVARFWPHKFSVSP
jgi:hypothetical protein